MYDIRPVTHRRRCRCGTIVTVTGTTGPSNICGACADALLAVIWGGAWPAMRAHLANHGKFAYPGGGSSGRAVHPPRRRVSGSRGRRL